MGTPSNAGTFTIESFDIVRQFVEHVLDKNAPMVDGNGDQHRIAIDWQAVGVSVADARTLEQAVGRAVVIADQVYRGKCDRYQLLEVPTPQKVEDSFLHLRETSTPQRVEDPFFAFSLADVVPDFGDESRYRSKMRRRVSKMFATRRPVAAGTLVDPADRANSSAKAEQNDPSRLPDE